MSNNNSIVVNLILWVLVFVVLLSIMLYIKAPGEDMALDFACKLSIDVNGMKQYILDDNLKYKCSTSENNFSALNQNKTFKKLAIEMKKCNSLFSYGNTNIFPKLKTGESVCGVCSFNQINEIHNYTKFNDFIFDSDMNPNYFSQILGSDQNLDMNNSPIFFNEFKPKENLLIGVKFTKTMSTFSDLKSNSFVGRLNDYVGNQLTDLSYVVQDASLYSVGSGLIVGTSLILISGPGLLVTTTAAGGATVVGGVYSLYYNTESFINQKQLFYTSIIVGNLEKDKLKDLGCNMVIF